MRIKKFIIVNPNHHLTWWRWVETWGGRCLDFISPANEMRMGSISNLSTLSFLLPLTEEENKSVHHNVRNTLQLSQTISSSYHEVNTGTLQNSRLLSLTFERAATNDFWQYPYSTDAVTVWKGGGKVWSVCWCFEVQMCSSSRRWTIDLNET